MVSLTELARVFFTVGPFYIEKTTGRVVSKSIMVDECCVSDGTTIEYRFPADAHPNCRGKVVIPFDENLHDENRFLPIPIYSIAKTRQDYLEGLHLSAEMLTQYELTGFPHFEHDATCLFAYQRLKRPCLS